MAALISQANLLAYADKIASVYTMVSPVLGLKATLGTPTDGSGINQMNGLQNLVLGLNVYEQVIDLLQAADTALKATPTETVLAYLNQAIQALVSHCQQRGSSVAASIVDLDSFLAYYNGGAGGALFSGLLTPDFQQLYLAENGIAPAPTGVMSPAIQPTYNSQYPNGMATKTVPGVFTAGANVDTTQYQCVLPVLEVITNFASGTGAASLTINGTDDQGNAATWGPTVITGGNNPVSALSGITVTPAITTTGRQTVAFSSTTGIVPGSVLIINNGLVDQETVIVEAVPGSVTLVFKKEHAAGATVTGVTSTVMGAASTGATRRIQSVTSLTFTLNGQTAGAVRIAGKQDRVAF